ELTQLVLQLGLEGRVMFLGPKSPNELKDLYQTADVFVLPSSGEALPSVVSEAMLCGTPVVASNVGGVREQLGEFGVTVPPGNVDRLALAVESVFGNYCKYEA